MEERALPLRWNGRLCVACVCVFSERINQFYSWKCFLIIHADSLATSSSALSLSFLPLYRSVSFRLSQNTKSSTSNYIASITCRLSRYPVAGAGRISPPSEAIGMIVQLNFIDDISTLFLVLLIYDFVMSEMNDIVLGSAVVALSSTTAISISLCGSICRDRTEKEPRENE